MLHVVTVQTVQNRKYCADVLHVVTVWCVHVVTVWFFMCSKNALCRMSVLSIRKD